MGTEPIAFGSALHRRSEKITSDLPRSRHNINANPEDRFDRHLDRRLSLVVTAMAGRCDSLSSSDSSLLYLLCTNTALSCPNSRQMEVCLAVVEDYEVFFGHPCNNDIVLSRLARKGTKWYFFFGKQVFHTNSCSDLSEFQQIKIQKASVVTEIQLFECNSELD